MSILHVEIADTNRKKGVIVYSRDGKVKGRLTGGSRKCTMESCSGLRLAVRWQDNGDMTWPCTDGMTWRKRSWRLI